MTIKQSTENRYLPLTPDELVLRDNIPASKPVPPKIARFLETRRLTISSSEPDSDLRKRITRLEDSAGDWQVELPPHAILGRAVQTAERFAPGSLNGRVSDQNSTKGFCPDWMSRVYHPKLATASQPPRLRTLSGGRLTPHAVYGNDDRQVFYPSGYPWECIGRVFVWDDASQPSWIRSGAGALVGSRIVLTADHLMPRNPQPGQWKVQFVPAYYDGGSVAGSGADSWVSDYRALGDGTVSAFDMAVLRLYDPLGDALGCFGYRVYEEGWEDQPLWEEVGYPGAISSGERPTFQRDISVVDSEADGDALEIEHLGDTSGGNSGGPLFAFWPDWPYIIGTESGWESSQIDTPIGTIVMENNVAAGGKAMVDLLHWARSNWP